MTDWQPIETAPKDRSAILLLSPTGDIGIGYLEVSVYDDLRFNSGSAAWAGKKRPMDLTTVWLGGYRAEEATHWHPLPAAPDTPM